MIFKALKTKDTKEFVGEIMGGYIFTSSIPKLFPKTFDLEQFQKDSSISKSILNNLYVVIVKIEDVFKKERM